MKVQTIVMLAFRPGFVQFCSLLKDIIPYNIYNIGLLNWLSLRFHVHCVEEGQLPIIYTFFENNIFCKV